jgi:hypothetical protein
LENSSFLSGLGVWVTRKWWWWWWCGTDLEKSAEFCLTISPSHQAGQPAVTNSLIRINCTAAAAATSEKHEGTTFLGLNCSTKLFWYTQRFRSIKVRTTTGDHFCMWKFVVFF